MERPEEKEGQNTLDGGMENLPVISLTFHPSMVGT
jgi:hypothetical protein